jgi:peptide/nickel transport system substrate-binding protein
VRLRTVKQVSILVAFGLLLSACGTPAAEPAAPPEATTPPEAAATTAPEATPAPASEIKRGGVLKVGIEGDFTDLDPAHEETLIDQYAIDMVYEGLVRWDPVTLEPEPLLATSWEISDDGLTYTFYLQDGVKWHNGDDFVAEDVKYTVERIIDPDEGSVKQTYLESVESVEVVDDYTVVFHLSEPYAALVNTAPFVPKIQNRNFVEANDGHTPRTMMGTGPFKFVDRVLSGRR